MNIAAIMPQLQRGQALFQSGRTVEAWTVLAPLRMAINGHVQALGLYALAAQAAGRIDEAVEALKRLSVLQNDPPEILGAIADTYGKAGRHAEAFRHWQVMAARFPEIIEAHLNCAVAAASAGRHDDAIDATDRGLKRFPGEARLLATKAMALKNADRIPEAAAAFELAVAADPQRALTRHNQAVTLRAASRFEEACEAYQAAETLGMKGAQFHANWAAAALEASRLDQAEQLYLKALDEDPDHLESRKGLTRLKVEYRGGEGAFDHYQRIAEKRPNDPKGWFEWASALIVNRRTAEAQEVVERGLRQIPGSPPLRAVRSFARGMIGDSSAALDELEAVLADQPGNPNLEALIPQIAIRAGRPARAAELLEKRTASMPQDQLAWSMLALAWRLIDDPREFWLCDYDRLVIVADVPSAEGADDAAAYAAEIATLLDPLHVTLAEPGDQSLRGGTQTSGALFARPDPAIQHFRESVRRSVEAAIAGLPDDPAHPFLGRKSPHVDFSGSWSVRLAPGGHHASHVHPEGWMSSAYYARLPRVGDAEAAAAARDRQGWIQFGVPPEHLGLDLAPRRVIEPRPGRLVLFPSYLWHGTIPFDQGDRLTAAFDVLPR